MDSYLPRDVSPAMWQKQQEMVQAMTPEERVQLGWDINDFVRTSVENSIKEANPGISDIDLLIKVFERYYGHEYDEPMKARIIASIREYHAREEEK
ncbi:MAG: hypothetical protein AB8F95_05775 [Bacteroidia bacterium]